MQYFVKYKNRKFYNKTKRSYSSLKYILGLYKQGINFIIQTPDGVAVTEACLIDAIYRYHREDDSIKAAICQAYLAQELK